jgi:hypothetical protein
VEGWKGGRVEGCQDLGRKSAKGEDADAERVKTAGKGENAGEVERVAKG